MVLSDVCVSFNWNCNLDETNKKITPDEGIQC